MSVDSIGRIFNLAQLQNMLDPLNKPTIVPAYEEGGPAASVQAVTLDLNYTVKAIPIWDSLLNPNNEGVQDTQGLVLWFTQDGVDDIYHYGIVPATLTRPIYLQQNQAVINATLAARGLDLGPVYFGPPGNAGVSFAPGNSNGFRFTWLSAVALPRYGTDAIFKVSKTISDNFSRAKLVSGYLRIEGSAVSTTATTIAGTFSWGVLADSRDAARVTTQEGDTYAAAVIADQSFSPKDAMVNVPVKDGHVSIVGPDMTPDYVAPNSILTDTLNAQYTPPINIPIYASNPGGAGTTTDTGRAPYDVFSAWVTPTTTNFWVQRDGSADGVQPALHNRIETDPIAETGVLDITVRVPWSVEISSYANGQTLGVNLYVNAIHCFCVVDSAGDVFYNLFGETINQLKTSGDGVYNSTNNAGVINDPVAPSQFTFEPRRFRSSFTTTGKYVGTLLSCSMLMNFERQFLGGETVSLWVQQPQVVVAARNNDLGTRLGPVHVIRWDSVAVNQAMSMQARLNMAVVAEGNTASLLALQMENTPYAASPSLAYFIQRLWASGTRIFKRCYTGEEYKEAVKMGLMVLGSADDFESHVMEAGRQYGGSLRAAGASAGIFPLVSAIGKALNTGAAIASTAGGVLESLGLSAGQFKANVDRGYSAGQFGASAGSMQDRSYGMGSNGGYAAGQFRARY